MTSPFLSRPLRSLQQAAAEGGRVNCGTPTAMELAAAPFSNTEVIGERVTERYCTRCHGDKFPSTTPLCVHCRFDDGE